MCVVPPAGHVHLLVLPVQQLEVIHHIHTVLHGHVLALLVGHVPALHHWTEEEEDAGDRGGLMS